MTEVVSACGGGRFVLDVRGHAATRTVCAAVSCLLCSLAGWLHNADGAETLCERLEPGRARFVWRARTPEDEAACRAAFELAEIGFLQLQLAEPEQVRSIKEPPEGVL